MMGEEEESDTLLVWWVVMQCVFRKCESVKCKSVKVPQKVGKGEKDEGER
jgi:hypothetical protein